MRIPFIAVAAALLVSCMSAEAKVESCGADRRSDDDPRAFVMAEIGCRDGDEAEALMVALVEADRLSVLSVLDDGRKVAGCDFESTSRPKRCVGHNAGAENDEESRVRYASLLSENGDLRYGALSKVLSESLQRARAEVAVFARCGSDPDPVVARGCLDGGRAAAERSRRLVLDMARVETLRIAPGQQ